MNSKRLLAVASFIDKKDKVIDVGCDHGYLGIYLKQNNLCDDILLTDLRDTALNNAIENIKQNNLNIKTLKTDGLNNINLDEYNTISISGMGTLTIINILSLLKGNNLIDKLIIQSNNDLDILRKKIIELGYYLDDEITIYEKDIYYVICKFIKGNKKIDNNTILFGINKKDKKDYYNYLLNNYNTILNKIPSSDIEDIKIIKNKINILEKLLKECR